MTQVEERLPTMKERERERERERVRVESEGFFLLFFSAGD
jgi:hypothetical protein